MVVRISHINDRPISVQLPQQVICTVVETEPVIKGQTVTSSYKPALLDNGVRIGVPPFIAAGEKIVVGTEEANYVERAK
jgi:elongation factor P